MKLSRSFAIVIALLGCRTTAPVPARFVSTRPVQFHLAASEPTSGLLPAHVKNEARVVYIDPTIRLDERDIRTAAAVKGPHGEPAIQIVLSSAGSIKFGTFTREYTGKMVAIVVGGEIVSTPHIMGEMFDEKLDILGSFTESEAQHLAELLNRK